MLGPIVYSLIILNYLSFMHALISTYKMYYHLAFSLLELSLSYTFGPMASMKISLSPSLVLNLLCLMHYAAYNAFIKLTLSHQYHMQ